MVQTRPGAITADELHKVKASLDRLLLETKKIKSDDPFDLQYKDFVKYQMGLLAQNIKAGTSVKMSIEQASYFLNFYKKSGTKLTKIDFSSPELIKLVREYWDYVCTRGKLHRTSNGTKQSNTKLSKEGINKAKQQLHLFLKYVKFKVENPEFNERSFSCKTISLPDKINLILVNPLLKTNKPFLERKQISLAALKDFIDSFDKTNYNDILLATLLVMFSETGRRYSELTSMKIKSLQKKKDFYVAEMEHTKTRLRGNILIYSIPYLERYLARHPNPNDSESPLFINKKGKLINYANLRDVLMTYLEKYNLTHAEKIEFPPGHKFHFIRHFTSTRFIHWPHGLLNFYMGWAQEGTSDTYFEAHYNENLEKCYALLKETYRNENNPFLKNEPTTYLKKITQEAEDRDMDIIRREYRHMLKEKYQSKMDAEMERTK